MTTEKKIGLLIDGFCYELAAKGASWNLARHDEWRETVNRAVRAIKVVGARVLHGRVCAIAECDDGYVRAVPMRALDAMEHRRDAGARS